ncbi:MAG: NAD(P)H-hydrate dehydratase [Phycisphaerales bacterium]
MTVVLDDSPCPALPPRAAAGHKGTFGTVVLVGGSARDGLIMLGAPVLAARAAFRSGAGLVKLVTPASIAVAALAALPSATALVLPTAHDDTVEPHLAAATLDRALDPAARALVVGPGLGRGPGPVALTLRAVQQHDVHVVLDADGLNALAETSAFEREINAPLVITPHPGECARLMAPLGLKGDPAAPADRPAIAADLARRLGCVVVLKGAGTVVSDGLRTFINSTGTHALATAGTGDVLAGLIGGLIAQFVAPPEPPRPYPLPPRPRPAERPLDLYDAARIAVRAHGLAAEHWSRVARADAGLLAHELADHLPPVLSAMRSPTP